MDLDKVVAKDEKMKTKISQKLSEINLQIVKIQSPNKINTIDWRN